MRHCLKIAALALAPFIGMAETASPVDGVEMEDESLFKFDAGADVRIRQEIMHNIPTLPGGGMVGNPAVKKLEAKNQMRFRVRAWGEVTYGEHWRFYTRLCNEMRAGIVRKTHNATWPNEVVLDNLYLDGNHLFEGDVFENGWIDFRAGREDLIGLFGLNHIFADGCPDVGSRSAYSDIVRAAFHYDKDTWLDVFGIFNKDREQVRLGTKRSYRGTQLSGFGGNDTEMDDWGFGTIFNSRVDLLKYQLMWIQKDTASFHRGGVKHPRRNVNMFGFKLMPEWTDNLTTPIEGYVQVGRNGENKDLLAWSAYAGFDWRDRSKAEWRPFWSGGLHVLSGDRHASTEDGGRNAWDPMWYRGVDDSEMMAYGSLYGGCWWSNMYNLKTTAGLEIARRHKVSLMASAMFAEEQDGLGGGSGMFKGFLTQARYDFPLFPSFFGCGSDPEKTGLKRFEMFGHILLEFFNPGEYFESSKPAYFVRWQVDFKF